MFRVVVGRVGKEGVVGRCCCGQGEVDVFLIIRQLQQEILIELAQTLIDHRGRIQYQNPHKAGLIPPVPFKWSTGAIPTNLVIITFPNPPQPIVGNHLARK